MSWHFLWNMLESFRFHRWWISQIMNCVRSSSFTILVNNNLLITSSLLWAFINVVLCLHTFISSLLILCLRFCKWLPQSKLQTHVSQLRRSGQFHIFFLQKIVYQWATCQPEMQSLLERFYRSTVVLQGSREIYSIQLCTLAQRSKFS